MVPSPAEKAWVMCWNLFKPKETSTRVLALVTANFGGIDELKALPPHDGVDAFYYADCGPSNEAALAASRTWTKVVVPNYPRHDFNPRLRARYFKHQIHRLDEVREYRWLVWADSSVLFSDLSFLSTQAARLARLPAHQRVLLVPHPDRETIWDEFQYIEGEIRSGNAYLRLRYEQEKMPEQMEYFRSRGWDLRAKLWCGTVWMIENSELNRRAWDAWWDQNLRFGMMDQLSLPVILTSFGIEPQALAVPLWKNDHFSYVQHARAM